MGTTRSLQRPSAAALSGSSSGCQGTLLKPFPFRVLFLTVSSHRKWVFCLGCWEITSKSLPGLSACMMKPISSLQTFLSICFLNVLRTMREPRGSHTATTCSDPDELPIFVCSLKYVLSNPSKGTKLWGGNWVCGHMGLKKPVSSLASSKLMHMKYFRLGKVLKEGNVL